MVHTLPLAKGNIKKKKKKKTPKGAQLGDEDVWMIIFLNIRSNIFSGKTKETRT
jgi:hypothetical protein